jgi:hypothetical protein
MAYPSWLEKSLLLLSTVITVPGIIRGYDVSLVMKVSCTSLKVRSTSGVNLIPSYFVDFTATPKDRRFSALLTKAHSIDAENANPRPVSYIGSSCNTYPHVAIIIFNVCLLCCQCFRNV